MEHPNVNQKMKAIFIIDGMLAWSMRMALLVTITAQDPVNLGFLPDM